MKKEEKLAIILKQSGVRLSSGVLPYPKIQDIEKSKYQDGVFKIYVELGGIQSKFPLNLRKWDLEADGVIIEFDEQLHFNRYRAITLNSKVYQELIRFPAELYKTYCSNYENECLKAGS